MMLLVKIEKITREDQIIKRFKRFNDLIDQYV